MSSPRLLILVLFGCSAPASPAQQAAVTPPAALAVTAKAVETAPTPPDATAESPDAALFAPASARATPARIRAALFGAAPPAAARACDEDPRCLLQVGYAADPRARDLVLDLLDRFAIVVLPGQGETMAMSYRGTITVVPVLPIGAERKHLEWAHASFGSIAETLRAAAKPVGIRFPAVLSFVRSLHGKRTPSGYALDWQYTYNVQGSLNVSEDSVRSVAIHEMFHLVDVGERTSWSEQTFGDDVRAIVARCHGQYACLAPYAPTSLRVRGGTFYAFQPGNDIVVEYAAELATRVFDEQRGQLGTGPKLPAFKCGPAPNAKTWHALVQTYFGDVDRVPACP